MPTATISSSEQLPSTEPDGEVRAISEVTTSPEGGWIEIVYAGKRRRLALSDVNEAREPGIAPLDLADLEQPRLRQGKKVMLGRRVIDAYWLICLAEVSE